MNVKKKNSTLNTQGFQRTAQLVSPWCKKTPISKRKRHLKHDVYVITHQVESAFHIALFK